MQKFRDLKGIYKVVIGIFVAVIALSGLCATVIQIEDRYAHASDVELVASAVQGLAITIQQDRIGAQIIAVQNRIWQLEDHYSKNPPVPIPIQEELRYLRGELSRLQRTLGGK